MQEKQAEAETLRQQLSQARKALEVAQSKLDDARARLLKLHVNTEEYIQLSAYITECSNNKWTQKGAVSSLDRRLNKVYQPPAPVLMPVPLDEKAALAWVFHMHMPLLFRHLSRASFLAQQLLIPSPEHASGVDISAPSFKTDLLQHYNQQQSNKTHLASPSLHLGSSGCVELLSCEPVPQFPGPDHIKKIKPRCVCLYDNNQAPKASLWNGL